jgi:mRNA interferase MazF
VEGLRRGDIVAIALAGDYSKPRPALVVQANAFSALPSVTVLPLTTELHREHLVRISVAPTRSNGLHHPSQVMIDKAATVPLAKIGQYIGHINAGTMHTVNQVLAKFLGLT